jgi:bifunctional DNA-binding transcriptional regulator/antitoxin component of YhaV-PrlF toxin-antitoxin module
MEQPSHHSTTQALSKMHSGGRLVVPSHIRAALHLNVGDELLLRVEEGGLRVISRMEAIRRAQRLIAQYIPASVSLVDELIADRRAEAAREDMEFQASQSGSLSE